MNKFQDYENKLHQDQRDENEEWQKRLEEIRKRAASHAEEVKTYLEGKGLNLHVTTKKDGFEIIKGQRKLTVDIQYDGKYKVFTDTGNRLQQQLTKQLSSATEEEMMKAVIDFVK